MKTFLKACVLAFLSMTVGGPVANLAFGQAPLLMPQFAASTCPPGVSTEEEFLKDASTRLKVTIRTFTDSGQAKMRNYYNSSLSRTSVPPLPDAAKFYFGEVKGSNMTQTGVVLMLEGCVVPGSVAVVDNADFATFVAKAGVTPEEMIIAPYGTEM